MASLALTLAACSQHEPEPCGWGERHVHEGAPEICDWLDNDCDGLIDFDPDGAGYVDSDGDGSAGTPTVAACAALSQTLDDCDESDPTISENAIDICGDGIDSDCNGVADDDGCADWYRAGDTETLGAGHYLSVAQGDPSHWGFAATRSDYAGGIAGGLKVGAGAELQPSWRMGDDAKIGGPFVAASPAGNLLVAYLERGDDQYSVMLLEVGTGDADPEAFLELEVVPETWPVEALDFWAGDVAPGFLVKPLTDVAYRIEAPPDGRWEITEVAVATYESENVDEGFGSALLYLPDPGGDGIPEVVAGAEGTSGTFHRSGIYVFDGADVGTLLGEDAIAYRWYERGHMVEGLRRAGDLDGDGTEDLLQDSGGHVVVEFGPFFGEMELAMDYTGGGDEATAEHSWNGDDQADLAVYTPEQETDAIYVYSGPLVPGSYGPEDADRRIPLAKQTVRELAFADVDRDGNADLVAGYSGWQGIDGTGDELGMIVVFDLLGP